MLKLAYPTGRDYGAPQILEITLTMPDRSGDPFTDVRVTFNDAVRGIAGEVGLFLAQLTSSREIGEAVLREYDAGRYTLI